MSCATSDTVGRDRSGVLDAAGGIVVEDDV